jgi:phage terminase small subunit
MKKLIDRHKNVIDNYLSNGLNKTQAVIDAGYSKKYANTNVKQIFDRPEVKAYIALKQDELAAEKRIDREFILNEYLQLLDSCKKEGLDGAGNIKDRSNWAKSLSQLTKMLGMDAPEKTEIDIKGATINILNPKDKNE